MALDQYIFVQQAVASQVCKLAFLAFCSVIPSYLVCLATPSSLVLHQPSALVSLYPASALHLVAQTSWEMSCSFLSPLMLYLSRFPFSLSLHRYLAPVVPADWFLRLEVLHHCLQGGV